MQCKDPAASSWASSYHRAERTRLPPQLTPRLLTDCLRLQLPPANVAALLASTTTVPPEDLLRLIPLLRLVGGP